METWPSGGGGQRGNQTRNITNLLNCFPLNRCHAARQKSFSSQALGLGPASRGPMVRKRTRSQADENSTLGKSVRLNPPYYLASAAPLVRKQLFATRYRSPRLLYSPNPSNLLRRLAVRARQDNPNSVLKQVYPWLLSFIPTVPKLDSSKLASLVF